MFTQEWREGGQIYKRVRDKIFILTHLIETEEEHTGKRNKKGLRFKYPYQISTKNSYIDHDYGLRVCHGTPNKTYWITCFNCEQALDTMLELEKLYEQGLNAEQVQEAYEPVCF